jgi:ceramide glucosyltransferase
MQGTLMELGMIMAAAAAAYALLAALGTTLAALRARRPRPQGESNDGESDLPAVTVLKPLCGSESELYERLCSLCVQDFPRARFQIVFGVHNRADTALPVAQRVQQQFPHLDIQCVVDPTRHGVNSKVSNLLNMLPRARHDLLIIADSDIAVPPDYLRRVLAPLADPGVGLVTCAYTGQPTAGLWSALGAQFINAWFMPSVYVATLSGLQWFVSGATIALRRDLLARGGGLRGLADQLADDFKLGAQVRALGLRVVVSDLRVHTQVDEPSCSALLRHSLRWLRTIRAVRPWAYIGCLFTFSLPLAVLGAALTRFHPDALLLLAITAVARVVLHFNGQRARWRQIGLIPLHDVLLLILWCWGFAGQQVSWRQERFGVGRDGSLYRVP